LRGGKKYEFGPASIFLTCGPPTDPLCGRSRPACHILTTDLRGQRAVGQLKAYEKAARQDVRERCSEWLDFVDRTLTDPTSRTEIQPS
jgi:hypothetical protein